MPGSSLELSPSTEQRLLAAAAVLRLSPDAFLRRLLSQHYNTLGGLPLDLLRYVLSFLDYTTICGVTARVSKFWQDCVLESPHNFFSRLRQMHGIHLLDPVHGMFYFPRALKRVVFDSKGCSGGPSGGAAVGLRSGADLRRAFSPATAALHSNAQAVPASSFLTVDIRTQNTKTLPWGYVQMTVRRAIERERAEFGAVRTPGLQHPEDPVWSQAATVSYDRRIYMFGGETYEGLVLDRVYEYDPMTKHWTVLPELNEKRAAASAVAFHGRIFVFGGYNEAGEVLDTYEVFDVATRTWLSRVYPPAWLYTPSPRPPHAHPDPGKAKGRDRISTLSTPVATPTLDTVVQGNQCAFHSISSIVHQVAAGEAPSPYRMPEKVCGTAATVYGDVILFAGGHQSCIAPDQTAVSYSAMNSASTTPMHSVSGPYTGGGGTGGLSNRSVTSTPSPAFVNSNNASNNNVNIGGFGESTWAMAGTPVLGGFDSLTSPTTTTTAGNNANTNASTRTNSPPRLPRVNSIAFDGPTTAETLVWIFSPVTGEWWKGGPRLPSPRAFGALTVLDLPVLGPCLCYFGGCAKADAPETAMFYIPLNDAQSTRVDSAGSAPAGESVDSSLSGSKGSRDADLNTVAARTTEEEKKEKEEGEGSCTVPSPITASFLRSAQDPWPASLREAPSQTPQHVAGSDGGATAVTAGQVARAILTCVSTTGATGVVRLVSPGQRSLHTPVSADSPARAAAEPGNSSNNDHNTPCTTAQSPTTDKPAAGAVDMVARCFRDLEELPWQRYVRVPIGGAFTSVAVLGHPQSRTVVLTGFYPAPNIGFCKVDHLLPPDAFTPLLRALSPPPPPPPPPEEPPLAPESASPPAQPLPEAMAQPSSQQVAAGLHTPPQQQQLDPSPEEEAAAAALHYHQEREWSHHQRQEVREMVRSAARAATLRHPRNPQTAGEERKWSLAPVPEVRVRNPTGPALTRVSWKVQSLNAKLIVGIE